VNIYVLYIHDDRYTVPTVDSLSASSDEVAAYLMENRLGSSPHYFAAELWLDERLIARLAKTPDQTRCTG
jgi:hypothetical protein